MDFLDWQPEYETKIRQMDEQHKNLVNKINEVYEKIDKLTYAESKEVFIWLKAHLEEHFATEEGLMKEFNDPGYISHKLEHERFYNSILDALNYLEEDKGKLSKEFLGRIKIWFINHFDFKDKKLGEHLHKLGVE